MCVRVCVCVWTRACAYCTTPHALPQLLPQDHACDETKLHPRYPPTMQRCRAKILINVQSG